MEALAKWIVASRKAKGLQQTAVATVLGVRQQDVSAWELGRAQPTADHLNTLVKLFEVDLPSFDTGSEKVPVESGPRLRIVDDDGSPGAETPVLDGRRFATAILEPRLQSGKPMGADEIAFLRDVARVLYGFDL